MDLEEAATVAKWLKRIEASELSVSEFFSTTAVPFSRRQYFKYKQRLQESGPAGLLDRRSRGGNRKVTPEQEGFLKGCIKRDPGGFSDAQREALDQVRSAVWQLYRDLKAYQAEPTAEAKRSLEEWFDTLCTTPTCFASLNLALKRMHRNKAELLLALERPELPLHNNLSEGDIREYVKRRKISGGTRSDEGRRCRDTFASLKKTCRKLGVSFWSFLNDRLRGAGQIPALPILIETRAQAP